ncbi:MAG: surface lipoprotein assembly modifier [Woeseia sp.]
MNQMTLQTIKAMFVATLLVCQADAADKAQFDFRAAAGYHYDSNVSVSELDTNTGEADNALLLDLGVDASLPVTDALSFKFGYGYAQTSYQDFSEFDTAIHRLQGDLLYRVGGFDTGLALRHFGARLDNDRFLDIRQVSPSVARLLGKKVYLRGAYTNSEKQYADREARDATNDALDLDVYLLLDGMQRYLSFSYRVDSEDAAADELDFDGNRARLSFGQRFDKLELKARAQLEERDYSKLNEEIGAQRRDRKFRAGLNANYAISDMFSIEGEAQFSDTASNLASADFDEMTYSINLAAEF